MNKNWVMSQESFEGLLDWLDPDRDQAGVKYEQIRGGLINYFTFRAPCDAEDLADETINRVISRLPEIKNQVNGEAPRYFYGVARKVHLEYLRRKTPQPRSEPVVDSERVEIEHQCLEQCMKKLSDENRQSESESVKSVHRFASFWTSLQKPRTPASPASPQL